MEKRSKDINKCADRQLIIDENKGMANELSRLSEKMKEKKVSDTFELCTVRKN